MGKGLLIDSMHKGERLIDKVLRLRYPNYPHSLSPTISYNVISKYIKVPLERIRTIIRQFKKNLIRDDGVDRFDQRVRDRELLIQYATDPILLQQQACLSLKQRVEYYNLKKEPTDQPITIRKLRDTYHQYKIKRKHIIKKAFNSNKYDESIMTDMLIETQNKLIEADKNGYYIVQIDESIFNGQDFQKYAWCLPRRRTIIQQESHHIRWLCVVGAINAYTGQFQYAAQKDRFDRNHIKTFIQFIQHRIPNQKICIYMDNASIHNGAELRRKLEELDMISIYMPPYSPELNGIEKLWGVMKQKFRQIITEYKIKKRRFDIHDVLLRILNTIDKGLIKRIAIKGWRDVIYDKRNPRLDITHFQGHKL